MENLFAAPAAMFGRKRKQMRKHADDLPAHALAIMKETLDLCGDVFPRVNRKDLADVFVNCYFKQQAQDEQPS